jgi:glycosyltransferase involved in cell wall biosynthesis/SAM-dependent methyltransferase
MLPKDTKEVSFLCFGGEDWWYHNRGHIDFQLMRRFATKQKTLYINSLMTQKPRLSEGRKFIQKLVRKTKSIFRGLRDSGAGFWVYSPFLLPVHHIRWMRPLNEMLLRVQLWFAMRKTGICNPVVWVACPTACNVATNMKKKKLVYQRTDCFEAYPNVDVDMITKYDRRLKAEADLTLFVSMDLYQKESGQCRKALFLDHGVDFEMFASAVRVREKPSDIASVPGPIVGYFGALDEHKLDVDFIEKTADLLPEVCFVFIGKASPAFSRLSEKKNVRLLGQKDYEQIPHYGKCFDVAMIPWRQNRWTKAANPIKVKEYLALGKPIVSTPVFGEIDKYRDVMYVADSPEEFAGCIDRAISEDNPHRAQARCEKVKSSTWDSKAKLVLKELLNSDGGSNSWEKARVIQSRPVINRMRFFARWSKSALKALKAGHLDFVANIFRAQTKLVWLTLRDLFLRRKAVQCNICGWSGHGFYPNVGWGYDDDSVLCPGCGCLDRYRSLAAILWTRTEFFSPDKYVIEVAPSANFQKYCLAQKDNKNYVSFDIERFAMEKGDLTRMHYQDGIADYFLCFHVLEHIKKEARALEEIRRVLKPGGRAILQVPVDWDAEKTYEYPEPDPRDVGHVRRYGRDFAQRISEAGFEVAEVSVCECLADGEIERFGLSREPVFIAAKPL